MPDSTFDSSHQPIPPTHPAIKALTVVVGLGFLAVLAAPHLEKFLASLRATQAGPEFHRFGPEDFAHRGPGRHALNEPFHGITTDGSVRPDLFPIRATGATTEPVRRAAEAFLESLSPEQKKMTNFPVDDKEWRDWVGGPIYTRHGISLQVMTDSQRERALDLLRASLSDRGLKTVTNIIKLNNNLGVLPDASAGFDHNPYFLTVMGTPSATEPWGWQFEGNHLVINDFVLGDQVVMTPTCLNSEPTTATKGPDQGTEVLQDEQNKGLEFVNSLTPDQQKAAILASRKKGRETVAEVYQDNAIVSATGIKASEFTETQQTQFLDLIELYVGIMDDAHARIKLDEIRDHLDETSFTWIGGHDAESVFYYRIQSPVILIEFDHQNPGPHGRMGRRDQHEHQPDVTQQHIHTVIRTPNGNDYGKALLGQHAKRPTQAN